METFLAHSILFLRVRVHRDRTIACYRTQQMRKKYKKYVYMYFCSSIFPQANEIQLCKIFCDDQLPHWNGKNCSQTIFFFQTCSMFIYNWVEIYTFRVSKIRPRTERWIKYTFGKLESMFTCSLTNSIYIYIYIYTSIMQPFRAGFGKLGVTC